MPVNIPETEKKRVVIIGAGFAGLKLARELYKKGYQVVLVDRNNYHQFQPLFYQVATSGLEPSSISFPLRKVFQKVKNVYIRVADVEQIFPEKKIISSSLGSIWYDYLVIATGASTNFFGNDSFERNGIPMKSVAEALYLRNRILLNFEKAVTLRDPEKLGQVLSILVVGGGPTGVEICGALAEMKKFVLPKDYPDVDFTLMEITLVEAGAELLGGMSKASGEKAREYLEKLGIKVLLSHKVINYDGLTVALEDKESFRTETLIWAAGIKGQLPGGINKANIIRGNRIKVGRFNQVEDMDAVYAIGDIAWMSTEKYPQGHPQVAQVALQQASALAKNLGYAQQNRPWQKFEYQDRGSMATVGRNRAVVDLPFLRFNGPLAWLTWMFVHLMSIVGVKNRLLIFINWFWSYITFDQSLRLIIKPSAKSLDEGSKGSPGMKNDAAH